MKHIIEIKNLTKKYNNCIVLKNVNINIEKNEIYGLIGKNGAGKTTLMKIILGLESATNGSVEIHKENNIKHLNMGALIDSPAFYPYLSAKENLEYYRILKDIKDTTLVDRLLNLVKLNNTNNKPYKHFSLGMKQRLGLAFSLLTNPSILILDEPINGLDPEGIKDFRDILLDIQKKNNTTIIISSHILSELSQIATQYIFIDKGIVLETISSYELEKKCNYALLKTNSMDSAIEILNKKEQFRNYDILDSEYIKVYCDKSNIYNLIKIMGTLCTLQDYNEFNANLEEYFLNLIGGN